MPSIVLPLNDPRVILPSMVFFSSSMVSVAAKLGAGLPMYHSILLLSRTMLRRLLTMAGTKFPCSSCRATYHLPSSFSNDLASPCSAAPPSPRRGLPIMHAMPRTTLATTIDLMMNPLEKTDSPYQEPLNDNHFRILRFFRAVAALRWHEVLDSATASVNMAGRTALAPFRGGHAPTLL